MLKALYLGRLSKGVCEYMSSFLSAIRITSMPYPPPLSNKVLMAAGFPNNVLQVPPVSHTFGGKLAVAKAL